MTIYLSGSVSPALREHAGRPELGVLVQPRTTAYMADVPAFGTWGFDNDCFAQGDTFDSRAWFAMVLALPTGAVGPRFVTAPDVVGDAVATWQRSAPWLGRIRRAGQPAALVFQDGIEHTDIQWSGFDAVFIGGSTEWKLSDTAAALIHEANARGKWTHVGRVNSGRRYQWCRHHGAKSCDGTFIAYGPTTNVPRMLRWFA